ncbi:serine hydrolase domain-containing protein [Novosphingobium terrae]|uniref:serine hydrolase domain-containing protein n=1 Tax=Novosphingobium terrae TaxID=2726189 RepID=UPI001981CE16|nr:serine hydrolase domain-containing protein [Novosphingobium terrae]
MDLLNAGQKEAVLALEAAAQRDIDKELCHGVAMRVMIGGETVHSATLGHSDKAAGRETREDDVFLGMSISKAFCASVFLQLVDRGEVQLDLPVAEYLPEFGVKGKQRATVRQLLTHQAGTFAGFVLPPPLDWMKDSGNLEKCVAAVCAQPAAYVPGERVVYNPWASFALLAEIVRRAEGGTSRFSDIANRRLFAPLGMKDSGYGHALDDPRRVPVKVLDPFTGPPERAITETLNLTINAECEIPAGGAFTTLNDASRFVEMLRRGGTLDGTRILSPSLTQYALKNHTGALENGFWDYSREQRGIASFPARFTLLGGYTRGDGPWISAMGLTASPGSYAAVGGGSTMVMFDPERELSFVFLAAGFLEGLGHFQRLQKLSDLALAIAP